MTPSALLLGSIGVIAETSDLQRRAYNRAFAEAELDWVWDRGSYRRMLERPGGKRRLAEYAEAAGDVVDADALHAAKERHFAVIVRAGGIAPRAGVAEAVAAARRAGVPVAFCTTTTPAQAALIAEGTGLAFDWVGDETVAARKPAPDVYLAACAALGADPASAVAVEDTPESARSPLAAGCRTLGLPGEAARRRAFPAGVEVVGRLDPAALGLGRVAAEPLP